MCNNLVVLCSAHDEMSELIIVKESKGEDPDSPYPFVMPESICEISILKYLNSLPVIEEFGYNPFPELYYCSAELNQSDEIVTYMKMNNVGQSIQSISVGLNFDQRCELVDTHLDDIIHCVEFLHRHGLIHNDLHFNNIMLSKEGRVYIIDFGISQLNDMVSDSEVIRPIPGSYKNSPASDIWLLGAYMVELCQDDGAQPDANWAVAMLYEQCGYTVSKLYNLIMTGELDYEIQISEAIPQLLRSRLQIMISINNDHREYSVDEEVVEVSNGWSVGMITADNEIRVVFESLLDYTLNRFLRVNHSKSYNVTVAVSILCRWFSLHSSKLNRAEIRKVSIAVFIIASNCYIRDNELDSYIDCERTEDIVACQIQILEALDWRIFTHWNTVTIGDVDVEQLIEVIKSDSQRGHYFLVSESALVRRYTELLE